MSDGRRDLPSVGALLETEGVRELFAETARSVVAEAVRVAVAAARRDPKHAPASGQAWTTAVAAALREMERPSLRPVINATGVVLHTNLGRAPLAAVALGAIQRVASGFSNVEYDLDRGERGSRHVHAIPLLCELTGAQDAIVVNNCAGALVLALDTVARGKDAVVSRGELVEIGGSFRVPDIMAKSGARLVEVGTTNRTHLADFAAAIGASTGAIVRVHRSNFALTGFTSDVPVSDLVALATAAGIPSIHDLGSGLMMSLAPWGLTGEPTAGEAVSAGATLVLMSGDKLLGGPQSGIILGSRESIASLRTNPLARALRVDKLTLAALEATLALYREPERARREIPALAMLTASASDIRERAATVARTLTDARVRCGVVESEASVGGGAFPTARIPSAAVVVEGDAGTLARRLRDADVPVIGRIADGRVHLDMRSVLPAEDQALIAAVRHVSGIAPA
ncbi:MAG: L-seryl-tRNA(Sec) selenium transferase [Gemmatimonadaceae bacterium]